MGLTKEARIGKVFSGTGYVLSDEDCLGPDISILLNEQIGSLDPQEIPAIAPVLAVEIVSSEPAELLERKIRTYLAAGTRTVLALYPTERTIMLRELNNVARVFRGDDPVTIDWMPDFSVPASKFFEGL